MRFVGLLLLLVTTCLAHAQVYRWVDEKGTVHYSNATPPAGVKAVTVDVEPKPGAPSTESAECYTVRCQGERLEQRLARREETEARLAAERAQSMPKPPRGLAFSRYISIQRGMSAGEVLGIAGDPDLLVDEGLAVSAPTTVQSGRVTRSAARTALAMKTFTYLPTPADPFTTIITLVGGRVSEIERIRKF